MEQKQIEITVDRNDADYVTEITNIDAKYLEELRPLFEKIQACKENHNFPCPDPGPYNEWDKTKDEMYPGMKELISFLEGEFCPDCDFHSIVKVEVCPIMKKETLVRR